MANLTSVINVNVPSDVKEEANNIFNQLGLNMSTAINMFLKRAIYEQGIPFSLTLPKKEYDPELLKYFTKEELDEGAKELDYMEKHLNEYKKYNNMDDLINSLNSDD